MWFHRERRGSGRASTHSTNTSATLVWDLDKYWINSKCPEKALTPKIKEKMDLNVPVWDDCIHPVRALVFVPVQREARMQADNEMSGAGEGSGSGGQAARVGVHLPSSSLSSVSGQSLLPEPSRSRIIFISTERGRKEGATMEGRGTPLWMMILTTAVEETGKRFCLTGDKL